MGTFEIETTLAICTESPKAVVGEIAALRDIGPYCLVSRPDMTISDVYLELPGARLRHAGQGLRLRMIDGNRLITLKGRPEELPGGGLRREETELAWSREAMESVAQRLADVGVRLTLPDSCAAWDDPDAIASELGFVTDQIRHTVRRPRDVSLGGERHTLIAEMVIDSVAYVFDTEKVNHHEVEVEIKGAGTVEDIQGLTSSLLEMWPRSLREWHYGKRATGRAAASLLATHDRSEILSSDGALRPSSYDRLLALLERG